VNGIEKLFEFLIVLMLEINRLLNEIGYALDPTLAEVSLSFIQLVYVPLNVIQNVIGTILALFEFFKHLQAH
jgi:hypothetical protein